MARLEKVREFVRRRVTKATHGIRRSKKPTIGTSAGTQHTVSTTVTGTITATTTLSDPATSPNPSMGGAHQVEKIMSPIALAESPLGSGDKTTGPLLSSSPTSTPTTPRSAQSNSDSPSTATSSMSDDCERPNTAVTGGSKAPSGFLHMESASVTTPGPGTVETSPPVIVGSKRPSSLQESAMGRTLTTSLWEGRLRKRKIPVPGESPLLALRDALAGFNCERCGNPVTVFGEARVMFETFGMLEKGSLGPGLRCPGCRVSHCGRCGYDAKVNDADGAVTLRGKNIKREGVFWCCDDSRMTLLWATCLGHEEKPTGSKSSNIASAIGKVINVGSSSASATPKGVGYGGAGFDLGLSAKLTWGNGPGASTSETQYDKTLANYFSALTSLLRGPDDAVFQGRWPSWVEMATEILSRSPLLSKAADLLRGACIEDLVHRAKLYNALASFLEALMEREITKSLIQDDIKVYPSKARLADITFSRPGKEPAMDTVEETRKGLGAILTGNRDTYWNTIKYASGHKDEFAGDGATLLAGCKRYLAIANQIAASQAGSSADALAGPSSRKTPTEPDAANRRSWYAEYRVRDLPEDELRKSYAFAADYQKGGTPERGRMKKLITDLAALRTSLPEGIFVCHGTSRLDVMKVLIVGPESTPYAGGLWEFSLWFPMKFPQVPPMMKNHTTGGGRVRFNPNLYHDGQVCLSLLNTWSQGQSWQPGQSTILQVLVSIQAMIFCEEPWYNEPGREMRNDPVRSEAENMALQGATIEHAMLPWLQNLPPANSKTMPAMPGDTDMYVWSEVVRHHFATNGETILKTVKKWKGARMVPVLTAALKKHGFVA